MAKKEKKDKPEQSARDERAPEMPAEQALQRILLAAVEKPARGVPVFVGPTQYGKTLFLRNFLIEDLGVPPQNVVWMNPQHDLPEDLGGWPMRDGSVLRFTQPANIPPRFVDPSFYDQDGNPKEKWGIIVDEIDKAREETLSAMLTFFNPDERRLRNTRISPRVPILGAMNEPENRIMPDPLLARLLFLPFPCEGMRISSRPHLRAVENIAAELFGDVPAVRFPVRPKAPGSLHRLVEWLGADIFWASELPKKLIVRGLFNEQDAGVVLAKMRERLPEPTEEWARAVRPTEMIAQIVQVMSAGTYEQGVKVLHVLVERAKPENDPTGEMGRLFTAFLECPEALFAVHRDVPAGVAALKKRVAELDPLPPTAA